MSYIKREDAKNAIQNCITEQTVSKYATSAECRAARHGADLALFAIDYVPTADVVEVRRGEWTKEVTDMWHCSICLHPCLLDGGEEYVLSTYCPNCGAKMDGERREG